MGDSLNPITGSANRKVISLDAERQRAQSTAEPDPGASSYSTAPHPAKLLGTGRWDVRHVSVHDLPVVDSRDVDTSSVPLPTTEPPILPDSLFAEPTRPDFAALALVHGNKSETLLAAHLSRFERWWDNTYLTLVYHAASRIGRGGTLAELVAAFEAGELVGTAEFDLSSPYAAALVDRVRFLQAALVSEVPRVRQRGVERAALMLAYLKGELNEGERFDIARNLVEAGRGLIDSQEDQDDIIAAAVAMLRAINVEWRAGSLKDVIDIARTLQNSLVTEDTPANIGALGAFEGVVRMVPHDDDGDLRVLVESSRGVLGFIAREGATDRVKQSAREVLGVIDDRFPRRTARTMHEAVLSVSDGFGPFEAGARMNVGLPTNPTSCLRTPLKIG